MRLAVLSDIHSNIVALDACISLMERIPIDGVLLLGDYTSDFPHPTRTLDRLGQLRIKYPCYAVAGNREASFLAYHEGTEKNWEDTSYQGSLLYTYQRLRKKDFEWFETLPPTRVVEIPGTAKLRLAHGSPERIRELLNPGDENTKLCMQKLDTEYLLAGHTHRQGTFEYAGKLLINPGSVGVAIGVKLAAHMAFLEWKEERWKAELISVPYEYPRIEEEFSRSTLLEKAGLWPKCILKSILCGENMGPLCAKRAYDLAVQEQCTKKGEAIPESYFVRAAKEYGIE